MSKNVRTAQSTVNGVIVEIRTRISKRFTGPRYEIFLNGGAYSSGTVWRSGTKWASTEGPTFSSRRAAIASLIDLCVRRPGRVVAGEPARSKIQSAPDAVARRTLVTCPVCNVSVRETRLHSHLWRV